MDTTDKLDQKFQAKKSDFFPFIDSIRFPRYKALEADLRLDFDWPIVALIGPNGSNKSSILQALASTPEGKSLADYWFSTRLDDIDASTVDQGQHRFIYEYSWAENSPIAECRKYRGSKSYRGSDIPASFQGKKDPDYWEPTKRVAYDKMRPIPNAGFEEQISNDRSRWNQIIKNVIYLDFRSELSAFDKFMHHQSYSRWSRNRPQKRYRMIQNSNRVARSLEGHIRKSDAKKIIQEPFDMTKKDVDSVSEILGKRISRITLMEHSLFGPPGYTARLHLANDDYSYSEAHAGSGEYATIRLVHAISSAPKNSLILLDEPEVSLHPGAQVKLMDYVKRTCLSQGHQVVISTHSPTIATQLPDAAIRVLGFNPATNTVSLVQSGCSPSQAFTHLGQVTLGGSRVQIIVEDELAAEIVRYSLRAKSNVALKSTDVSPFPGGADGVVKHLIPSLALLKTKNVAILLDGDMKLASWKKVDNPQGWVDSAQLEGKQELESLWKETFCKTLPYVFPNSHGGSANQDSEAENLAQCLVWGCEHLGFLPGLSPEEALANAASLTIPEDVSPKTFWVNKAREAFGLSEDEVVDSLSILQTQRTYLAQLDRDNPLFLETRKELDRVSSFDPE